MGKHEAVWYYGCTDNFAGANTMSQENTVPQPPPVYEASKGRSAVRYVVFGCLGIGVIGIAGIALIIVYLMNAKSDVDPVVEHYLHTLDKGNYAETYATLGTQFKNSLSASDYAVFASAIHRQLGNYQSKSFRSINTQTNTQGKFTYMTYLTHFANGDVQAYFTLQQENGEWKIEGVHYTGDLIQKMLTCPHCGKLNSSYGRYCQFCGQPMNPDEGKAAAAK